jgi:hypothetical protein
MGGGGGPELSFCAKAIKVALVFFNIVFFLLGLAIIAIGVYVLADPSLKQLRHIGNSDVVALADQNGVNLTYIDKCGVAFIVFGGVMLAISFLGCCGAFRNYRCLLGFYSFILLVLLLAAVGMGIFAAVFAGKLRDLLTPVLQQSIQNSYLGDMSNKTLTSIAWDAVMYNVS